MSHPALVEVYDFGRDGDMDDIAMEWIDGRSLKDLVDAGPMDLEPALELLDFGLVAQAGRTALTKTGEMLGPRGLRPARHPRPHRRDRERPATHARTAPSTPSSSACAPAIDPRATPTQSKRWPP